jgi:hypothetical protein
VLSRNLRPLAGALAAGTAVITVWCAVAVSRSPLPWAGEDRAAEAAVGVLARSGLGAIRPGSHWVGLTIVDSSAFALGAGLVLELDRHGYHTVVTPASWQAQFGKEQFSSHPVDAQLLLFTSATWAAQAGTPAAGHFLARAGGTVLSAAT